ncbi:MAG: B12-binding domain-containing radical SAM protein [Patescibacteria group bacterium]
MKMRNVLLVYPEFEPSFWSFKFALRYIGKKSSMPPLGLLTIAGMFPEGYHLRLADMNVRPLTDRDIAWADLVCTSTMIVQRRSHAEVAVRCKNANKPVVAGGPYPTSYWEEMGDIDYLLLGEVEETFVPFLRDLESGTARRITAPPERPAITQTPMPRYDLIRMRDYGAMLLQFSRGCPFDCEFCDITKLYGRIPRTKSNEQMLAEFQMLYDLGRHGGLFLVDDNFIGNRRDALRFLKALAEWQRIHQYPFTLFTEASMNLVEHEELMDAMVAAGFKAVFVGIETPTPEALLITKKKQNVGKTDPEYPLHAVQILQHKGLEVMGGFILGLDGDGPDAFDAHIRFIQAAAIPIAMEGMLTALKGTDLYHRLQREGRLLGDTTGQNVTTQLNFIPQMPAQALVDGYKRVLDTIYDRGLKKYFQRCWDMNESIDRSAHPVSAQTPLMADQTIRFCIYTLGQLLSVEGPAYLRFLLRVLRKKPTLLREALAFGAKGHHLRKVTECVLAVDTFKEELAAELAAIQAYLSEQMRQSHDAIRTYMAGTARRVRSRYMALHEDFRHNAADALEAFLTSLERMTERYHSA